MLRDRLVEFSTLKENSWALKSFENNIFFHDWSNCEVIWVWRATWSLNFLSQMKNLTIWQKERCAFLEKATRKATRKNVRAISKDSLWVSSAMPIYNPSWVLFLPVAWCLLPHFHANKQKRWISTKTKANIWLQEIQAVLSFLLLMSNKQRCKKNVWSGRHVCKCCKTYLCFWRKLLIFSFQKCFQLIEYLERTIQA